MDPVSETPIRKSKYFTKVTVAILLLAFFALGYGLGLGKLKVSSTLKITRGTPPPNQSADYSLLWDALNELNTKSVDKPLDQQKLLYGAVAGLVAAAGDPYTVYFDPTQAKQFADQLKGTFGGIGAEVGIKNDQIVILAPLDDTPASKARLLAGDQILAINGESTANLTVEQAVLKIRGTPGTDVTLTILHPGKRSAQEVKLTRAQIVVKSLKLTEKDVNGKKIAVIKLSQFGDDTKGLFAAAVEKILSSGDQGIILDLRNDPGGYLDTAVNIASAWVDSGKTVVKETNYENQTKDYPAAGVSQLKGIKTIVLINQGSASASEILAGALQDYKLATLVGEKTFGKGSVQELDSLKDKSQIKITVAKWYTPNGRGIHKKGLEPDVKVPMSVEDLNAGKDPQMDKAVELMR
jgi:carboxyl-terminal processing protease